VLMLEIVVLVIVVVSVSISASASDHCLITLIYILLFSTVTLGVLEHSCSCCCSNPNDQTLLLCTSVYAVSADVLMHAVDLHKTASR